MGIWDLGSFGLMNKSWKTHPPLPPPSQKMAIWDFGSFGLTHPTSYNVGIWDLGSFGLRNKSGKTHPTLADLLLSSALVHRLFCTPVGYRIISL